MIWTGFTILALVTAILTLAKRQEAIREKVAVLHALGDGPAHRLELTMRVHTRTSGKLMLTRRRLDGALRGLERDGLVDSYEAAPLGRRRRYFRIRQVPAEGAGAARDQGGAA